MNLIATQDGGLGFCNPPLHDLLPAGYHGPLVVALDSNILIDLQDHGLALMNDEPLPDLPGNYRAELTSLGALLELWLLRDIRLVMTNRSRTDAKRIRQSDRAARRLASIDALAESLTFQTQDWTAPPPPPPSEPVRPLPAGDLGLSLSLGLRPGADLDLVVEATQVGAHVFLTRDQEVLARATIPVGLDFAIIPPSELIDRLAFVGAGHFGGGTCGRAECVYTDHSLPAPDLGKWSGVLSVLGSPDP